jgi:3'-phosphoadenosine 5'-phosphosulfate sulfotransferase (PAPS reductase)/FAD synthetase
MKTMTDPYKLPDGNVQISFSGGRTSAFMLNKILEANGDLPDRCQVTFANTGREMQQTLDFVHECSQRWGVEVVWLEFDRVDGKASYKRTSYEDASFLGEPFELLLQRKRYLPNVVSRFCTADLKIRPMKRYLVNEQGWKRWSACVGIRADESRRINHNSKDRWTYWYPLHDAGVTKRDIADFWAKQSFDLQLFNANGQTPKGNCDFCFLKSEATLATMAREHPDRAAWWIRMEEMTGGTFRKGRSLVEFVDFVQRQHDWVFDDQSFFCQADDGECTG